MRLADLTTLHVGGDADDLVEPTTRDELLERTMQAWATGDDWLLLGGGSNVVVSDDGFDGTVIRVATRGVERLAVETPALRPSAYLGDRAVRLRVQAGEPWDALVDLVGAQRLGRHRGAVGYPRVHRGGTHPEHRRLRAGARLEPGRHRIPGLPERGARRASRRRSWDSVTAPRC